ncbi:MAG: diguanylate cyclase [candidate division WOR-3 bacterium]
MKKKVKGIEEILKAINSPKIGIDEVLEIIMENVSGLLDAEAWSLLLLDKERNELVFKEVLGEKKNELKGKRMPADKGIVGWTVKNKKPIIVTDPYKDKRFYQSFDKETGFVTRNILSVPLVSKGKVLGVIEAINKKDGSKFNEEDLKLVNSYAEHAALALENANLVQSLKEKVRYLTLIFDINKTITSILNLEQLLEKSAELIQKAFDYYFVGIFLIKGHVAILKGFSIKGKIESFPKNIIKDRSLISKIFEEKDIIICEDTEKEKAFEESVEGIRSEMVIPIKKGGKLIGVITVGSPERFAFSKEEAKIIKEVSYQLGIAIDNARLYEKIKLATVTDELTGLFNSRYCNEYMPAIVEKWIRSGERGAVVFMDLDFFKRINDTYNHLIGSKLLRLVGKEIKKKIENKKHVGIRYGGDEYVIILNNLDLKRAIDFTKELKETISKKKFILKEGKETIEAQINASFGIACFPEDSKNFYDLLRLADLAMYYVKGRGRNNIAYINVERAISLIDER